MLFEDITAAVTNLDVPPTALRRSSLGGLVVLEGWEAGCRQGVEGDAKMCRSIVHRLTAAATAEKAGFARSTRRISTSRLRGSRRTPGGGYHGFTTRQKAQHFKGNLVVLLRLSSEPRARSARATFCGARRIMRRCENVPFDSPPPYGGGYSGEGRFRTEHTEDFEVAASW